MAPPAGAAERPGKIQPLDHAAQMSAPDAARIARQPGRHWRPACIRGHGCANCVLHERN